MRTISATGMPACTARASRAARVSARRRPPLRGLRLRDDGGRAPPRSPARQPPLLLETGASGGQSDRHPWLTDVPPSRFGPKPYENVPIGVRRHMTFGGPRMNETARFSVFYPTSQRAPLNWLFELEFVNLAPDKSWARGGSAPAKGGASRTEGCPGATLTLRHHCGDQTCNQPLSNLLAPPQSPQAQNSGHESGKKGQIEPCPSRQPQKGTAPEPVSLSCRIDQKSECEGHNPKAQILRQS